MKNPPPHICSRTSVEVPLPAFNASGRLFARRLTMSLLALACTIISQPTTALAVFDTVKPGVTVSAPSATTLSITGTPGGAYGVAGVAADNVGVDHVSISLNGGAPAMATLAVPGSMRTNYSYTLHPVGGSNTLRVQSFDTSGNASTIVTRSFTYVVRVALTVNTTGPGTVTGKLAGPVYQVGRTYVLTAVPSGPGTTNIFNGWTGDGLTTAAKALARLSFVFSDALALNPVISADFILNPFTPAIIGSFNGLVSPTTAPASNENSGFINFKVTTAGSFTGTLKIDARSLTLAGQFDNTGHAVFGATRASTVTIPRVGKASLVLGSVMLDLAPAGTHQITGTLGRQDRDAVQPMSAFAADRAAFNLANPVPAHYTVNSGRYTVIIPAQAQTNGLVSKDFPQGDGIGSLTVSPAGLVSMTGNLADGTAITATATLSAGLTCPLFSQIYASLAGSYGGLITLDDGAGQPDHDLAGTGFHWFRPYLGGQYYPYGWPEGVDTQPFGAKYVSVLGTCVLPGVTASSSRVHNALLWFQQGGLTSDVTKVLNISSFNVVTRFGFPADPSYYLGFNAATGRFGGSFTHTDGSMPTFHGVICQKGGAQQGGFGYFLAPRFKVLGGGQSGHVSLKASKGPMPVGLGLAGDFVILSKSGITDVASSAITGDIGTSPITGAAIGLTCAEVTGNIYTVDAAGPPCAIHDASRLSVAVGDMQTAYSDAAGRTLPNYTELGAGDISGKTLVPGLYKWSSSVGITGGVTLAGGAGDIWIFQIGGDLSAESGAIVHLSGGAQPKNIFWQVAGQTTLKTTSQFKGIILCQTLIALKTGATLNGRALAQTAVTLEKNAVKVP